MKTKVTKIRISLARLINLGNYENVRLEAEVEVLLGAETPETGFDEAYQVVADTIKRKIAYTINDTEVKKRGA